MQGANQMLDHLFSPISINGMILKNRIIADPTGDVFEEKALGGAALVIAGHAIVEPGKSSFSSKDEPWIFSKYERENTRQRVLKIHKGGAKASIELFHGGEGARVYDFAKGPSDEIRKDGTVVKAMNEAMMQETLDWYSKTAAAAKKIGFDSIFLHFGHGWLPAQFLSPIYNHRTDEYGGSIENRSRFPLRILEAVRKAVGPRFPVDMRISAYEWEENSITFDDVKTFLKLAEPYVDDVQVSSGMDLDRHANVHCITSFFEDYMTNADYSAEIRKILNIPVTVVGAIPTPEAADQLIAEGKADLVAYGRAFLCDPDWANKAMNNHTEDIVPCLRCLNCYHISSDHWNVGCSVNPRFHNESFIPEKLDQAEAKKRVVIIGAGPAGIKAAMAASDRGHEVILFEKSSEIGGMLKYISKEHHKDEVRRLLEYYHAQIAKRQIDLRLSTEATPGMIRDLNTDALILALGAHERRLPIKGSDRNNVVLATEALSFPEKVGNNVVILGGGSIGCELTLGFAEEGKEVSIVEMTGELAANANALQKEAMMQKYAMHPNIHVYLNSACMEIADKEVICRNHENSMVQIPYDTMVLSTGLSVDIEELKKFYGIVRNTISVGDCNRPSNIMNAVFEGYTAAINL